MRSVSTVETSVRKIRTTRVESKAASETSPVSHNLTFAILFTFTFIVYFRPHEVYPEIPFIAEIAFWSAAATLVIYFLSQANSTGSVTRFTPEVKAALALALIGLFSILIARDRDIAWHTFNDTFIKVMAIFLVMANILTNERRIKGLMWLGIGIGGYLSYQTYELFKQGVFNIEGYRVGVNFGGMFGNPNDMSIHLAMFIPISFALGLATRNIAAKLAYLSFAGIMSVAIALTQSRAGFLGLVAVGLALIWTLGRGRRVRAAIVAAVLATVFIAAAPGNYGTRVLSIFDSSLDVTGSSSERSEALTRSIIVTIRNPWGTGIGNSVTFGVRDLETHNAYTQVSSELGVAGLAAYLVLLIYPLRKLSRMEREMNSNGERASLYYLTVGTHAAIIGYMVSSFFASVAYLWYVYYPVAFAVGLRTIYETRATAAEQSTATQEQDTEKLTTRRRYFIPG